MSHSRDSRGAEAQNSGSGHQSLQQGDGPQNIFTGNAATLINNPTQNFYWQGTGTAPSTATSFTDLLGGYGNDPGGPTKSTMIKWLSYHHEEPYIDNDDYYYILLQKHVEGTNSSFLQNKKFIAWSMTGRVAVAGPSCLWVQGTLGSGKTMLWPSNISAYIVKHLRSVAKGHTVCLHYYVKDRPQSYQSPSSVSSPCIIRSILIQLLRRLPSESVNRAFDSEFRNFLTTNLPPNLAARWKLLKAQASIFDMVYIVIDSFDQYQDEQARIELCSMFNELPANMRVLISSRSGSSHSAGTHAETYGNLLLKPSAEDVGAYVKSRIEANGLMKNEVSETFKQHVARRVIKTSNSLFLLLELQLNCLCEQRDLAGIKRSLGDPTLSLNTAFEASVNQIKLGRSGISRTSYDFALAHHALTWIVHALRPLTGHELMESFAYRQSRTNPEEHKQKKVDWTWTCAGLVEEDPKSGVVRLMHEEVGRYLVRTGFVKTHYSHAIASLCLKYLVDNSHPASKPQRPPLLIYAATNWVAHFNDARKDLKINQGSGKARLADLQRLALDFLSNSSQVSASFEAVSRPDLESKDIAAMTGLHAATYLDLPELASLLVRNKSVDVNKTTLQGQTPLHWAVRYNRATMFNRLLKCDGIDHNLTDKLRATPLYYAVVCSRGNRHDIVRMLVEKPGVDLHQCGYNGFSPLSWSIQHGDLSIAETLLRTLEVGDVNKRDSHGWSLLRTVMYHGQSETLFDIVLNNGAELNNPEHDGWTPLMHAVRQKNVRQARRLLMRKPSPAKATLKEPTTDMSPLKQALAHNYSEVVNLLIDHGADVNEKFSDECKSTPLIELAIAGDHDTAFNMLRKRSVSLDEQDARGKTALHHAVERRNGQMVWLLLARNAGLTLRDITGDSVLDIAVGRDDVQIAWLLCHHGASLDAVDNKGMTSLHKAAGRAKTASVRLLLSWGADRNVRDHQGLTPMQHLTEGDAQTEVIRQMLQRS